MTDPFKGITTNGTVQPGLYSIRSTGVSTNPRAKPRLGPDQRRKTMFPVDDVEGRKWMNQDFYIRPGVSF